MSTQAHQISWSQMAKLAIGSLDLRPGTATEGSVCALFATRNPRDYGPPGS